MVFKMIMDASSEEEKPVVRGFLKHLVLGFAGGVAVGSIMLAILLLSLQGMDLDMPLHRTLRIFRKPFFLACFGSNLIGVGSGVLVVSTARQVSGKWALARSFCPWH